MDQYQQFFENSASTLFMVGADGEILDLNPAGVKLFGYSKNEVLGLKFLDLFVEVDERQKYRQEIEEVGWVKGIEAQLRKKDDAVIDCVVSVTTQRGNDGQILGYHGIIRDITRQKLAERALEAYNHRLEDVVQDHTAQLQLQLNHLTAVNAIIQLMASGHELQATLEIVAREMVHLFKARSCAIALLASDKITLEIMADYNREASDVSTVGLAFPLIHIRAALRVVNTGGAVVIRDAQTNSLTTPIHDLLKMRNTHCLMLLPLLSRGYIIGTIGVDLDEPDREFTPEELTLGEMIAIQIAGFIENMRLFDADFQHAYAQLQELDKLKTAFIGVITHELRSPFVAANLSAQLIERYAERKMFHELHNQVTQLKQELVEGRKVIDNVIAFASMVSKEHKLHLETTDFATLIKETANPLEDIAKTHQVNLSFKFDLKLRPVQVDKEQMSEAIYHLIHNAIKFNRPDGSVEIFYGQVKKQIVFTVKDTGLGLPPEKLNTIWEAFAQNSDDMKRGIEGLGLGLAMVRFIIKAHQGEVGATSTLGEGSVFGFRVPIEPD